MRITQVVRSDSFAGVERYICDVASELTELGHEVRVIGGAADRMQQELGPPVSWRPARTTADVARALAAGGRRDVVHVHMTAAELAGVITRPVHRAPIVSTRHFAGHRGSSFPARVTGKALRAGLAVEVAISDFVARNVEGSPRVLHNGTRKAPQAPLDDRVAVVLQRLEPEKQTEVAVRAWAASSLPEAGWTLLIAGRGRLEGGLRALVDGLDLSGSVRFIGHVRHTDDLLHRASIMIAPAPAEPFGLSVVEAMARGLPVAAAAGGAHTETVATRELLFPPGDVEALALLLDGLASDVARRQRLGHSLRDRQQALFTPQAHVSELVTLYTRLLRQQ